MSEGFFSKPDEMIVAKIDILADEINKLKAEIENLKAKPQEEFREIKMADGRVIKRKL